MSARKKTHSPSSAATPALVAVQQAGISVDLVSFPAGSAHFGADAVTELKSQGVAPGRVFKTLVVDLGKRPAAPGGQRLPTLAVCVIPVPSKLSLKKAAKALHVSQVTMADPAKAQRATGYVPGGISPIGHTTPLPVVIDTSATEHASIYVSAGRRGLDMGISPKDLCAVAGATFADLRA